MREYFLQITVSLELSCDFRNIYDVIRNAIFCEN